MAYEVLEHIEDDRAALVKWRQFLRPGGTLLLSVPAHMNQWTTSDEWAGHYRRYERIGLASLIVECGYTIDQLEVHGSPLANLINPIRVRIHARQLSRLRREETGGKDIGSAMSGVQRPVEMWLYPYLCSIPGRLLMQVSFLAQRMFGKFGIGKGYILRAINTGEEQCRREARE